MQTKILGVPKETTAQVERSTQTTVQAKVPEKNIIVPGETTAQVEKSMQTVVQAKVPEKNIIVPGETTAKAEKSMQAVVQAKVPEKNIIVPGETTAKAETVKTIESKATASSITQSQDSTSSVSVKNIEKTISKSENSMLAKILRWFR